MMSHDFFASTPDNIPLEWVIPICLVLGAIYFVMGSKDRREARKARLKK